jgi:NADH-quinone oxidoreductase subunit L
VNDILPWLVVACPLVGFLFNAFVGRSLTKAPMPVVERESAGRTPEEGSAPVGHGSSSFHLDKGGMGLVGGIATLLVAMAFGLSLILFFQIQGLTGEEKRIFSSAFSWMPQIGLNFQLVVDPLSVLMMLIITGIGALIHWYSMAYMSHDNGYARYFTYLNLFIFFMLLLVMGANLIVLFVGWEGVGLASYLLIGFWYERQSATDAGKKAFVVNRIGDCALLIALFAIYKYYGTFDYYGVNGILTQAGQALADKNGYQEAAVYYVPLLLFLGAAGKSAQIPLYVWLPDAMEGPTPVSALIHAATMVTGGVYLISRTHWLFLQSPNAMTIVALIGLATAFLAATIALVQNDIKKVLAYSTVSQLGYMFLACGVGAYGAAMFHVFTHAFFKALLFLGAGSVIHAMSGEQDMRKMGALASKIPTTWRTMWIGTIAIAGVPLAAGFFSKDEILANAFAAEPGTWLTPAALAVEGGKGHWMLYVVGVLVAAMTAFYMTRLMMKTFYGAPRYDEETAAHIHESPPAMTIPLWILAVGSAIGGFVGGFAPLGDRWPPWFERFLGQTVEWRTPALALEMPASTEWTLVIIASVVAVGGVAYAYSAYRKSKTGELLRPEQKTIGSLWWWLDNKWLVDEFYDDFLVQPIRRLSRWLWRVMDLRIVDGVVNGTTGLLRGLANAFAGWQSGYVRNYALTMFIGVVLVALVCLVGLKVAGR